MPVLLEYRGECPIQIQGQTRSLRQWRHYQGKRRNGNNPLQLRRDAGVWNDRLLLLRRRRPRLRPNIQLPSCSHLPGRLLQQGLLHLFRPPPAERDSQRCRRLDPDSVHPVHEVAFREVVYLRKCGPQTRAQLPQRRDNDALRHYRSALQS